jgi:uncharacterized membrane protein YccC
MRSDVEVTRARPPVRQRLKAGLVLVVAGGLAIWLLIGVIKTIFFVALGIAVVLAVLWALKTLFW